MRPVDLRGALLQALRPGVLDDDLVGLDVELEARGLLVEPFLHKHLRRGRVALSRSSLVAGHLGPVEHALRQLGVEPPPPDDYPEQARPWLGRDVRASTLGAAKARVEDRGEALFVKPRDQAKRFTGRVFSSADDFRSLPVTSPGLRVWCADVVDIAAEFRCFIVRDRVVGVRHYDGDLSAKPDPDVVRDVLHALAGALPAGCALDVAVLRSGQTVLLEVNDGYALGRYGLPADAYAELLLARWAELVQE